jgi:hypothetical protein
MDLIHKMAPAAGQLSARPIPRRLTFGVLATIAPLAFGRQILSLHRRLCRHGESDPLCGPHRGMIPAIVVSVLDSGDAIAGGSM